MSNHLLSEQLMHRAQSLFPGGVNSPVRAFVSVGGTPRVFSHGVGKWLYDVDGNAYIDFCSSWGPLALGYSHPQVVHAVKEQASKALSFGAPCALEVELGEKIQSMVPALELMRFVNSGTEATMSALRVARAATGRDKIVKFEGCYHGHTDALLVKAGSGLATLGNTSSSGVPAGAVQDTITAIYNSFESIEAIFAEYGSNIAALIVEPIAANMGLVLPQAGFLPFLRDITRKHGALLIFDEVMTGFRLAPGGAAEFFGIDADLHTFGKIVGGGLPTAVYGGKHAFMKHVAPLGKVYQAGTLSGNPLAMAAGLATLNAMEEANAWETLESLGKTLDQCVETTLKPYLAQGQLTYSRCGSFFCFFFGLSQPPQNFYEVTQGDMKTFARVYHAWLEEGIYLGPSGYEVGFLSLCHEREDFQKLVDVVKHQLSTLL